MASALDVPPFALNVPDIDSYYGIMHTLFALEDEEGFKIKNLDGELCITLDRNHKSFITFFEIFNEWQKQHEKLQNEEITQEEYDEWRYSYTASVAINTRKE